MSDGFRVRPIAFLVHRIMSRANWGPLPAVKWSRWWRFKRWVSEKWDRWSPV